jgi:hypothetical protein
MTHSFPDEGAITQQLVWKYGAITRSMRGLTGGFSQACGDFPVQNGVSKGGVFTDVRSGGTV